MQFVQAAGYVYLRRVSASTWQDCIKHHHKCIGVGCLRMFEVSIWQIHASIFARPSVWMWLVSNIVWQVTKHYGTLPSMPESALSNLSDLFALPFLALFSS